MNTLRKILLSLLGEKRYLKLLAFSFQRLYRTVGLGKDYQDVYFLKKIVQPGDYAVDIGAHLGYFAVELSRLVGDEGKLMAIEPVGKFHDTLQDLLKSMNCRNVELLRLAMGGDEPWVEMGIPRVNQVKKFAYARIKKSSATMDYVESEKVRNESGDNIFLSLPRLDFIKCDVEGLELAVFSAMKETLARHRPILLCELADRNDRKKLLEMLSPYSYSLYILENGMLEQLDADSPRSGISHNHYFIPAARSNRLAGILRQ